MNPMLKPGNEPDPGDMSTAFDPDAETDVPTKSPVAGEDEIDEIGDFA